MNLPAKEIAKFACGFEAFHALLHGYVWLSGTHLEFLTIELTPGLSLAAMIFNGVLAVALGIFAWRSQSRV